MKRFLLFLMLSTAVTVSAIGQTARVFTMDLDGNEAPLLNEADKVTYDEAGGIQGISGANEAAVKVFLPTAEKNTGAAVIICSGGALMFHSWGNDVEKMASWLNERGVAVIGLKYRLRQMPARPQRPADAGAARPLPPAGGAPMRLQLPDITGFDQLKNANASPDQSGRPDPSPSGPPSGPMPKQGRPSWPAAMGLP